MRLCIYGRDQANRKKHFQIWVFGKLLANYTAVCKTKLSLIRPKRIFLIYNENDIFSHKRFCIKDLCLLFAWLRKSFDFLKIVKEFKTSFLMEVVSTKLK